MTQHDVSKSVPPAPAAHNAPVASSQVPTHPIPPNNGTFDTSNIPEAKSDYSKKATLIFLASIGVTLLITGATGSRMLKKSSKTAASSVSTSSGSGSSKPASILSAGHGSISTAAKPASIATQVAKVVKPGAMRRSSSRLRDLFQDAAGSAVTALDFRANQHPEAVKSSFFGSLRATDNDDVPPHHASKNGEQQHDAGDIVVDAAKAFSIATAITLGSAGAVIFLLARHLEADDLPTFMERFRSRLMQPLSTAMAESDFVPEFMKIPEPVDTEESRALEAKEAQELQTLLNKEWKDLLQETGQSEGK